MVTMVNERDDTRAKPTGKGSKLRNQGSKPTGSQTMSFTPQYSDDPDYQTGSTKLNHRTRANAHEDSGKNPECCRELGLNCKKPLF